MKRLNEVSPANELATVDSQFPAEIEGPYYDGYHDSQGSDGDGNIFRKLLRALVKHWPLILCINILATAAAIVYVAQKPDYYKATARVQVNAETNPAMAGRGNGGSIIVSNPVADPAYFTTQLQILEGPGLLRRVIKTLDLQNNQDFKNPQAKKNYSVWQNVQRMFGFAPRNQDSEDSPEAVKAPDILPLTADKSLDPDEETQAYAGWVNAVRSSLAITPVKDNRTSNRETRLIDIEFIHQDPATAAKVVNTIGDVYVLQNLELKVQSNASAGDFLQKRIAELQAEIRSGEERLMNYARNNQIISLDADQNTVVQRLTALNTQLGQAENDRINAQSAYQAALQNQMRSSQAAIGDAQTSGLETQLNTLRQKLAQLRTEYTEEWYEVVQTKKQIESVEAQLNASRQRVSGVQIAGIQEKLNDALSRERELRANFEQQRAEVIRQNEASINYKIIQQEIDTNKQLLDSLLQRSRENDVILNDTPNNVLVVDRAAVPGSPIGPERRKNVIMAFFLSLGAGIGIAFLLEWLNDTVHNSDEIERSLGLPVLTAIPEAAGSLRRRILPGRLSLLRRNGRQRDYSNSEEFAGPQFREAFLQLRTHLMLSTAGGPPRTILVTSGEEGEGKTVTAVNLAQSLIKGSEKVLVVDADLRCPRVHQLKGISNEQGLTTLLATKEMTDELLDQIIYKGSDGEPDFLTGGERTVNPANLLFSEEMKTLLSRLSGRYSHIVIDSPPVLYFADSTILSTMVDSVIIVVRDEVSLRQSVIKTKKILQNVGANVVGMVVNGIPLRRTNYSRYGYYESANEAAAATAGEVLKLS